MTEHEMAELERDVDAWEALERASGKCPCNLAYPDDLGARIERMTEENGEEFFAGVTEWKIVERPADLRCDCCSDPQCACSTKA